MGFPLTSIVILTLNELEYTQRCVESILRHTHEPYELVFVDNASSDGTVEYLRSIGGATVIANEVNRGFGGGCNQGMAVARGDRICLLNNDTVVTGGWLAALHRGLDADAGRGIVGPRSNHVADAQLVEDVDYDVWTLDGLEQFAARWTREHHGGGFAMPRLIGFCMLFGRELVEHIGGFDVRFGAGNFEDDDLCLRAAVAGYSCWVCDDSFVHHFGSRTFASAGIEYGSSLTANWNRFVRKWNLGPMLADHERKVYFPGPVVEHATFDPRTHYSPLVAAPRGDQQVEFERRSRALLVPCDRRNPAATQEALQAACSSLSPADDVTVVVRIDPADPTSMDLLEQVADAIGDEQLPDLVVIEASDANDEALVEACDAVLCHGRAAAALAGMVRWIGRQPVGVSDIARVVASARAA